MSDRRALRVLVVEDSEIGARLVVSELERAGFAVTSERVEDAAAMHAALEAGPWDLVIADWTLPDFSALGALELLRGVDVDVPVIVVSGTTGEETAIAAMRAGAADVVLKEQLARLGPAVARELRESARRAERRGIERALRESEARFRRIVETTREGVSISSADGVFTYANRRLGELLGYPVEELIGRPFTDFLEARELPTVEQRLADRRRGASGQAEVAMRRKDGATLWVLAESNPIFGEGGRFEGILGMVTDISERKKAEERLRRQQERYRILFDLSPLPKWVYDLETLRIIEVNEAAVRHYGYSREEFLRLTLADLRPAEDLPQMLRALERAAPETPLFGTYRHRKKDGALIDVEVSGHAIDLDGRSCRLVVLNDVTERNRAEAALRASEERFRQLAETIDEVFWITDAEKRQMIYVSPAYQSIWGRSCQSLYDAPHTWVESIHPDDRARVLAAAMTKQASGDYDEEYRIARPDGSVRWIRDRAYPVRDAQGRAYRVVGVAQDITERRQLEDQLRQSQKIEAVGRLTGGIAHDFNNVLSVVFSSTFFLLETLAEGDPCRADALEIQAAAERAASLTHQLLAFSRKQVLAPTVLDLNALVGSMEKMLRRLIGEDIELSLELSPDLRRTRADGGQIEQVLMNLTVNARDAMAAGGKLTLRTANATLDRAYAERHFPAAAGEYVMLSVTDTGVGMSAEVQEHLFEPFFTTKEKGKGTGLGLSTSYGIVKQSGGYIAVYSELGHGTVFKVYLPCIEGAGASVQATPVQRPASMHGDETILLVDDDEMVRAAARRILELQGYQVLPAGGAEEGLALAARHQGAIDLVLTDVVMPGASGPEMVERLRGARPGLAVLLMSGFTEHSVLEQAIAGGAEHLQKPFTPESLGTRVRELLDRRKAQPGAGVDARPRA